MFDLFPLKNEKKVGRNEKHLIIGPPATLHRIYKNSQRRFYFYEKNVQHCQVLWESGVYELTHVFIPGISQHNLVFHEYSLLLKQ